MENENILLSVKDVKKYYIVKAGFLKKDTVRAVDGVSLNVHENTIHCIVGESGSGKSTLGRLMVGLEKPDAGAIYYRGEDLSKIRKIKEKWKTFRREVQMVFQNPYFSMNPRSTVKETLSKPFKVHKIKYDEADLERCLSEVGLTPPSYYINKYPHELSGGERQRISIARALTLKPRLIVLDEPTSQLDVSIKVQILDLLKKLQAEEKLSLVIISHELPFLKAFKGTISIMYNGIIVEEGTTDEIFNDPYHPYTIGLLNSILELNPEDAKEKGIFTLEGEPPSPINPPPGCRFHPRCPIAEPNCKTNTPQMIQITKNHKVACPIALKLFPNTTLESRTSIYKSQA